MSDVILNTSVERLCRKCGYDLRGIESNRCPECGETFDPKRLAGANIPWLRRQAIGSWRAYWATVAMVMFTPLRTGKDIWKAAVVDPNSAGKFRRVVLGQSVACAGVVAVAPVLWPGKSVVPLDLQFFAVAGIGGVLSLLFFLIAASDMGSYATLTIRREALWYRTLNCYSCAPLAMSPVAAIVFLASELFDTGGMILFALLALIAGWWWLASVLMCHTVNASVLQSLFRATMLPITWTLLAIISCVCGFGIGGVIAFLFSVAK